MEITLLSTPPERQIMSDESICAVPCHLRPLNHPTVNFCIDGVDIGTYVLQPVICVH